VASPSCGAPAARPAPEHAGQLDGAAQIYTPSINMIDSVPAGSNICARASRQRLWTGRCESSGVTIGGGGGLSQIEATSWSVPGEFAASRVVACACVAAAAVRAAPRTRATPAERHSGAGRLPVGPRPERADCASSSRWLEGATGSASGRVAAGAVGALRALWPAWPRARPRHRQIYYS
jgi:hypothetical protein